MNNKIKRTLAMLFIFLIVFNLLAENSLSAFAKETGSEIQAETQEINNELNKGTIADASRSNDSVSNDSVSSDSGSKDSGSKDSESSDSGFKDSGFKDSGSSDSGFNDSGFNDSGFKDSGFKDSGSSDSGFNDSGFNDSGSKDSGFKDSGFKDSGFNDSGFKDSGFSDLVSSDSVSSDSGSDDSRSNDSRSDDSVSDVSVTDASVIDASITDLSGSDLANRDAQVHEIINMDKKDSGQSQGTEVDHLLTVRFLHEGSGALAAPNYEGWYYTGDTYTVPVPVISGYEPYLQSDGTPANGSLSGTINHEEKITIIYKPVNGSYTVNHKTEQLGGGYSPYSSEVKRGYVKQMTIEQPQTITGYIPQPFSNIQIQSDKAGDTVLEILYNLVEYTVKFQSNGGSYVATQYVKHGGSIHTEKAIPAREGYTFAGWYEDAALSIPLTSQVTITRERIFYAKWTPVSASYTIVLWLENADDTNYSLYSTRTEKALTDSKVTINEKTYTVPNGFFDSSKTETETIAGDGSTVINVYYKRSTYTITFYVKKTPVGSITAKYESNIIREWEATVGPGTGYELYVWKSNITGYDYSTLELMPGYDMRLDQRKYGTGNTHVVNYWIENKGGTYDKYKTVSIEASNIIQLTFEEEFHSIRGYYRSHSNVKWSAWDSTGIAEFPPDKTANLYYKLNTYTIQYVNSDLTDTTDYKYTADISGAGSAPSDRPTGVGADWRFGGWYTDETLQRQFDFTGAAMPASNVILHAKWLPPQYTVSFATNDGSFVASQTVTFGNMVSEPAADPVKADYFFAGWYADAACSSHFDFGMAITGNTTVYAKWNPDLSTSYTIVYKTSNDGGLTYTDLFPPVTYTGTVGYWVHAYPRKHASLTPDNYDIAKQLVKNPDGNTITFYYSEGEVWYRVKYEDTLGQPLAADKVVPTKSRRVIEYARNISGYSLVDPGDTRKAVNLTKETSEAAISQNVVRYRYKADFSNLRFNDVSVTYDGKGCSAKLSGTIPTDIIEYSDSSGLLTGNPTFTDAGTYHVNVKVKRGGYEITISAVIEIGKASVIIATENSGKYYDGTPLTAAGTISGIIAGETCTFTVTGEQTHVGSSPNGYTLVWNGDAKSSNYAVTENLGTLEVKQNPTNKITVTANSDTKTYDGIALENAGYTYTGSFYGSDYLVVTINGNQKGAGISANRVADIKVYNADNKDVTTDYALGSKDGYLTVKKKELTVTTSTESKTYDETPLTGTGRLTGIIADETYTFIVTGSQTDPGRSVNTYTLTGGTFQQDNYAIIESLGTLTVYKTEHNVITVEADEAQIVYEETILHEKTDITTPDYQEVPISFTQLKEHNSTNTKEQITVIPGSHAVKSTGEELTIPDTPAQTSESPKSPRTDEKDYIPLCTIALFGSLSLLTALIYTRRKRIRR